MTEFEQHKQLINESDIKLDLIGRADYNIRFLKSISKGALEIEFDCFVSASFNTEMEAENTVVIIDIEDIHREEGGSYDFTVKELLELEGLIEKKIQL